MQDSHFTEDLLDDKHWVNVQDPIKHMFLSISKAIRIQAAGIRDLDRKCSDFITAEGLRRFSKEMLDQTCSKQDATQLIYQIESKVSEKDFRSLEHKVQQMSLSMERLSQQVTSQQSVIEELTDRNQQLTQEIDQLKKPNYDTIFEFLQKHLFSFSQELEKKLVLKCDKYEVETILPKKLEDLYLSLASKIQEIRSEMQQTIVTRDAIAGILQSKVDRKEFQDFCFTCRDYLSRSDLTPIVNHQVKPLMLAMSSLEKAIQLQENMNKETNHQTQLQLQSVNKTHQEIINSGLLSMISPTNNMTGNTGGMFQHPFFQQQLQQKLEYLLQDHQSTTHQQLKTTVEKTIQEHQDYLLRQLQLSQESLRLEITTLQREEMEIYQLKTSTKLDEQQHLLTELSEKHGKLKKSMKELSLNMAKSLAKKLDIKDFKTIWKNYHHNHQDNDFNRTGYTMMDVPVGSSERLVQTSRHLLQSTTTPRRSGGGGGRSHSSSRHRHQHPSTSEGEEVPYASTASDPNREFDFLIQSMKQRRERKATTSGVASSPSSSSSEEFVEEERDELEEMKSSTFLPPPPPSTSRSKSASPTRRSHVPVKASKSVRETTSHSGSSQLSVIVMKNELQQIKETISKLSTEMAEIKATQKYFTSPNPVSNMTTTTTNNSNTETNKKKPATAAATTSHSTATHNSLEALINLNDWRIALGEVAMNLRRELADKASREELYSVVRVENNLIENRLTTLEKLENHFISQKQFQPLALEIQSLRNRLSLELTGAKFLWTGGKLIEDSWIAWDTQMINATPSTIIWKKHSANITIRIPGLYKVSIAIFTTESTIVQLYLNQEPIFALQPDRLQPPHPTNTTTTTTTPQYQAPSSSTTPKQDLQYLLQRFKHSLGEVSCLHLEEYVSLPPEGTLSVRYYSSQLAQGFFSIQKL